MIMKTRMGVLSCATGLAAFCASAYADQAAQSVGDAQANLAEIIVTAQKREQSINDVGASIAALGADSIAVQRITDLESVARAVPGLQFTPSNTNTPVLTLRGVG